MVAPVPKMSRGKPKKSSRRRGRVGYHLAGYFRPAYPFAVSLCGRTQLTCHTPVAVRAGCLTLWLVVGMAMAAHGADDWQDQHDHLVARLRALEPIAGHWGPAYGALYRVALPWYERWGGNPRHDVDDWMMPPEQYAAEFADALEHGRNFLAENPQALVPLVFTAPRPDGGTFEANYWITLPSGFPGEGQTYPLIISLHGSGWLGHKLSFVRRARKDPSGGRTFTVTPIDEAGPWQIDFLNAYLDERCCARFRSIPTVSTWRVTASARWRRGNGR